MWRSFLTQWNCRSFFVDEEIIAPDFDLFTDATSSVGYGSYFQEGWIAHQRPNILFEEREPPIAFLELYLIAMAAALWGYLWSNKRIRFLCDNTTTVAICNKGRSKCPLVMQLTRKLVLTTARRNFVFYATHLPGKRHSIGDALSRLQLSKFRRLAPTAQKEQTPVLSMVDITYPPLQT
ncbi:uncharacterized protein [Haliotis asinina]|uniref:uncharacterized protein n=1 Tax=Haliotis asinina TaxID=109174 RepID=UPI0035323658